MRLSVVIAAAVALLAPISAFANGGGPLLLIINGLTFLYGGLVIIAVEWALYVHWARIPAKIAFWDAVTANLVSTVLVGLGVPLLLATVSGVSSVVLPEAIGSFAMALGTWVWEGMSFPAVTFSSTAFWWVVTFFLTVLNEKAVINKRWKARHFKSELSAGSLSWRCNAVTYAGLLLVIGGSFVYSYFKNQG